MRVFSQLYSAQLENRSSDYSAGTRGRFWINNTSTEMKYDTGNEVVAVPGHIIGTTSFTVPNASSATNVTGLSVAGGTYRAAIVTFSLRRKDDADIRVFCGHLYLVYDDVAADWDIVEVSQGNVANSGTVFTITAAGQVQVATDNMSGGNYAGSMKFRVEAFDA